MPFQEQHPSILEQFSDFTRILQGKRLAVFTDYDGMQRNLSAFAVHWTAALFWQLHLTSLRGTGTLTPIVKDPDRAFMSEKVAHIHIRDCKFRCAALRTASRVPQQAWNFCCN